MNNISEITEQLEKGVRNVFEGEAYSEYLKTMSKFYNYSFNNTVLIWCQKPDASLVAGYRAWQTKFKRQVKKGEKAIRILAPMPKSFIKEETDEHGNKTKKEVKWTEYRAVSVFDVSQTEGKELPSIVKTLEGNVEGYNELFNKLKSTSPVPVEFEEITSGANGYFNLVDKRIAVKEGMSEQQTIKTLIHEISHAMLHNQETGIEKDADKNTKEVQAESIAYTVCSFLGLDTSEYSFGYVAGWSKGKELAELEASMEVIKNTASTIIEAIK